MAKAQAYFDFNKISLILIKIHKNLSTDTPYDFPKCRDDWIYDF